MGRHTVGAAGAADLHMNLHTAGADLHTVEAADLRINHLHGGAAAVPFLTALFAAAAPSSVETAAGCFPNSPGDARKTRCFPNFPNGDSKIHDFPLRLFLRCFHFLRLFPYYSPFLRCFS